MKKLLVLIFTLFLWMSVSVFAQNYISIFQDDFNNLNNWSLYGSPTPQWISSIKGRSGVFDNNGDGNYNSGAISKQTFNISNGFVLESDVYLDFTNLAGCWTGAAIGIANPSYQTWGGYDPSVYFTLFANGDACWGSDASTRRHALFMGQYPIDSGSGYEIFGYPGGTNPTVINADQYANGWHTLKISVDQNRMPKFYVDNILIYSGQQPISSSVSAQNRSLWLGERSSGSAGKAYQDNIKLSIYNTVTGIIEDKLYAIPSEFSLSQNYPNPFNPTTKIRYSILKESIVSLKVYDILGKEVAALVDGVKSPGVYEVNFISSNLASGIYFYTIRAGEFSQTKKLILMK